MFKVIGCGINIYVAVSPYDNVREHASALSDNVMPVLLFAGSNRFCVISSLTPTCVPAPISISLSRTPRSITAPAQIIVSSMITESLTTAPGSTQTPGERTIWITGQLGSLLTQDAQPATCATGQNQGQYTHSSSSIKGSNRSRARYEPSAGSRRYAPVQSGGSIPHNCACHARDNAHQSGDHVLDTAGENQGPGLPGVA